jgi:recombination protein RecR
MFKDTPSLDKLIHYLSQLPSVGPKSAQRLAYYILKSPDEFSYDLSKAMIQVKENTKLCEECYSYTENSSLCHFCQASHRHSHTICVVEDPADIIRLDQSGAYNGLFHVLHGTISPLDGLEPEDVKIPELLERINRLSQDEENQVQEVILALDADLEGDTTALFLAKILNERGLRVTRIAHGVPIGSDIDFVDHRTLGRALENRVKL